MAPAKKRSHGSEPSSDGAATQPTQLPAASASLLSMGFGYRKQETDGSLSHTFGKPIKKEPTDTLGDAARTAALDFQAKKKQKASDASTRSSSSAAS
eukprot:10160824-Alexandrium_andersonii.AAC.1